MHFAVTAAFLLPPEKALKKTPTLLGAYFLAPSTVCSSNRLIAGEFCALPVIPCERPPFVAEIAEFLIVASCAVYFRPAEALYSEGVN
jgi:hypothetical protein